jgi:hypothetical protein
LEISLSTTNQVPFKKKQKKKQDKSSCSEDVGISVDYSAHKQVNWGFFEPAYTQLSIQPLIFLGPPKSLVRPFFIDCQARKKTSRQFLKLLDLNFDNPGRS